MKVTSSLLVSIFLFSLFSITGYAQVADNTSLNTKTAPDFTIPILDGRNFKLSAFIGRMPVIIANAIPSTDGGQAALLKLAEMYDRFPGKLEIIAIDSSTNTTPEELSKFVNEHNIKLRVAHDPENQVIPLFGHPIEPSISLVDIEGFMVFKSELLNDSSLSKVMTTLNLKDPETSDEFAQRAYGYYDSRGEIDSAMEDFKTALELDSDNPQANCGYGEILFDKGDLEGASEYLDKAIELEKTNVRAYYNRANIETKRRNYERAIEIYKKGLETNPANPNLMGNLESLETKLKILNTEAPDFIIQTIDGKTFSSSEIKGKKALVVDRWATWCPPCRLTMPALQEFYDKYSDDVVVLGISTEKDLELIQNFIKENDYTFLIAQDAEGSIANLFPTKGIPYLTVINKDGIIVETVTGFHEGIIEDLEEFLGM